MHFIVEWEKYLEFQLAFDSKILNGFKRFAVK